MVQNPDDCNFSLETFWDILQNILAFLFHTVKYDKIIAYSLFTIFNIFGAMQQLLGKTLNYNFIIVLIASFFFYYLLSVPSVMKLWQNFPFLISNHTLLHWRIFFFSNDIYIYSWSGREDKKLTLCRVEL